VFTITAPRGQSTKLQSFGGRASLAMPAFDRFFAEPRHIIGLSRSPAGAIERLVAQRRFVGNAVEFGGGSPALCWAQRSSLIEPTNTSYRALKPPQAGHVKLLRGQHDVSLTGPAPGDSYMRCTALETRTSMSRGFRRSVLASSKARHQADLGLSSSQSAGSVGQQSGVAEVWAPDRRRAAQF